MHAFTDEIAERVAQARASLEQARLGGDDYLADIRLGELDSLARLAREHDVDVPGLNTHEGLAESVIDLRLPGEARLR